LTRKHAKRLPLDFSRSKSNLASKAALTLILSLRERRTMKSPGEGKENAKPAKPSAVNLNQS
jgi:hypothetical protein